MIPHDTIAALSISVYEDPEPLKRLELAHRPPDLVSFAWIPQTIADQIWVVYEFKSREAREAWEGTLPEQLRALLNRKLIPHALPFGPGVRDLNGFPT